jgi:hypothetical protein
MTVILLFLTIFLVYKSYISAILFQSPNVKGTPFMSTSAAGIGAELGGTIGSGAVSGAESSFGKAILDNPFAIWNAVPSALGQN